MFGFVLVESSSVDGACADLVLDATSVGHVDIALLYEQGLLKLTTSVTIAAYEPLRVSAAILVVKLHYITS